ncbi:MAG TPA: dodecin [Salinisphaeraceae bacterium]|nr:dodecin [Salinisphaeraceae bacterium]
MADNVYKITELTGSSEISQEDAIRNAITCAGETIDHLRWFEVINTRGHIENGEVAHWQVTLKLGFTIDATDA